jgi:uncharacterized C2H2 Zn-finger protein
MAKDRTREVEERLKAIKVEKSDGCCFFAPREGSIFKIQICAFCQYGKFEDGKSLGLCKSRRLPEKEDQE